MTQWENDIHENKWSKDLKETMFPLEKCISVKRDVWTTIDGMLLIKISSCKKCLGCLDRLGTTNPSVNGESDMEWVKVSQARMWISLHKLIIL